MLTFVWFVVWMFHGHPYVLDEWNPWNISVLVTAFLDTTGTRAVWS